MFEWLKYLPLGKNSWRAAWWYNKKEKAVMPFSVNTDWTINAISKGFELAVTQWLVPGNWKIDKYWTNETITTISDPEDVREVWWIYNYDDNNTAPIAFLSSSDAANNQIIEVIWLDIDWYEIIQSITLNWLNNVTLPTPLWRVYRMQNIDITSPIWTVYCHIDAALTLWVPTIANTRAIINNTHSLPNNQTLMTILTIPKWKVWFLYKWEVWLKMTWWPSDVAEYWHFHYHSRRYWKTFLVKKAVDCIVWGSSVYQDKRSFPDIIPSLTDIKITIVEVSVDMWVWATFDILLVDETEFTNEYLAEIWQPWY